MRDELRNGWAISRRKAVWEGAYPVRVTSATLSSHQAACSCDVSCRDIGTKTRRLTAPITPLPMSSLFIPISQNRSRLHATHIILNTSSVLLRRRYVRCDVAHNLQLSNWPNTAARKKTWVAWILGERARVREKDVQVRLTLYHSFSTKCVLTSLDRKWQWVLSDEQCIKLQRDKWNDGGGVNYNCLSISHS